ncbi:MAG: transglycosylase domain-containing protein [Frankiaceae bacterium]
MRLLAAQTDDERQEATRMTLDRKLRELRLALALERRCSKDEIFTRYLNIAYFGEGAYGIEAAAQRYFGVPAKKLRVGQAGSRRPGREPGRAARRASRKAPPHLSRNPGMPR